MNGRKSIIVLLVFILLCTGLIIKWALCFSEKMDHPDIDEKYISRYEWTLEIPNNYTEIYRINGSDERFAAKTSIRTYKIIDCYGNVIVPYEYDVIDDVSRNGMYLVGKDTNKGVNRNPIYLWGFINNEGEYVVDAVYGEMKNYVGEYAIGRREGQWKVIDIMGNVIYENSEELFSTKYAGVFRFTQDGVAYLVNISNSEIIEFTGYDNLTWEVEEIETVKREASGHRVEEYHGMYGIVKAND